MTMHVDLHCHPAGTAAPACGSLDLALAVLAHELRNPLSAIGLAASVLEGRVPEDPRCGMLLSAIASNVALAARMVEDLLQHSQLTAGSFHLDRSACSLGDSMRQWAAIALRQMGQPDRTVVLQIPAADILVHIDAMRMQQVFVNLIANALRYTPEPGRIWLTIRRDQECVVVDVVDEGIGMERQRVASLFEPLAVPRLSSSKLGLGLGLSVVGRIVERHGGSVHAHSDGPGCGSRFTVRLPSDAQ